MTVDNIQSTVARSKLTFPVTLVYALMVWLASGLIAEGWWPQLACMVLSAGLMMQLNNSHVLIRVYSRLVCCFFMLLYCCLCFLFPRLGEAVMTTCVIASFLILFYTYQDKEAGGVAFYAFLLLGLASMAYVHVLCFIPPLWLLMATCLMSLSWRTWAASLLGLVTPYWLAAGWLFLNGDLLMLWQHLAQLADVRTPMDVATLTTGQMLAAGGITLLAITGIIHFIRQSYYDKIRTRMFYQFLIWVDLLALALLILQPQHYGAMMRLMCVCTAPLAAHFFALTATRVTGVAFLVTLALILMLTIYNCAWTL